MWNILFRDSVDVNDTAAVATTVAAAAAAVDAAPVVRQ